MPKFVIYEVWTRAEVVEADGYEAAIRAHDPLPMPDHPEFSLCNWHAVEVPTDGRAVEVPAKEKDR